jgi:hypothetical protein
VKPIDRIRPHPQLANHYLVEFADGSSVIVSRPKLEQLNLATYIKANGPLQEDVDVHVEPDQQT